MWYQGRLDEVDNMCAGPPGLHLKSTTWQRLCFYGGPVILWSWKGSERDQTSCSYWLPRTQTRVTHGMVWPILTDLAIYLVCVVVTNVLLLYILLLENYKINTTC